MTFFMSKHGAKVHISNGNKQWNLSRGGVIPWNNFSTDERDEDTINSLLEEGSLVIPRSIAHLFDDFPYPIHGPVQKNKNKLMTVIVQPEELIINKKYARKAELWLKEHGITLPLDGNGDSVI